MSILTYEHPNENDKFAKYSINKESNKIGFEKCFILKIKCKVIHILNRLICLVINFFNFIKKFTHKHYYMCGPSKDKFLKL